MPKNLNSEQIKRLLMSPFIRSAAGSLGMRIAQALTGLFISIFLARHLGVEGIGTYSSIIAIFQIIVLPVQAGIGTLIGRQVVRLHLHERWDEMRGLLTWSLSFAAAYATIASLILLAFRSYSDILSDVSWTLVPIIIVTMTLARLLGAYHRGLKKIITAQSYDFLRNFFFALAVAISIFSSTQVTAQMAIVVYTIAGAIATFLLLMRAYKDSPAPLLCVKTIRFQSRKWVSLAFTYMLINGVMKLGDHTSIILVRAIGGAREAGLFQPAYQISTLILFGLTAVTITVTPYFTQFHEEKDMQRLQVLAKQVARASFAFATLCAILIALFGKDVLGILYGEEFKAAQPILLIVSVAYLAQAFTGASAPLLVATGHEKSLLKITSLALLASIATSLILIPHYGGIGAGASVASSMFVLNVGAWLSCKKHLNINSDPFTAAKQKLG
jgi:O-antigen/teichoic acid export membrane protein